MAHTTSYAKIIDSVPSKGKYIDDKSVVRPLAYSIPATAALFGISQSQTWALIRDRKIRSIKLGRRTLVTAQEVDRILECGC